MKTPHFCGDYAHNIKEATPFLPKGYRFLNDGEIIPRNAKFITHTGLVRDSFGFGEEVMRGYLCPHIVKVTTKKSAPKPLDRLAELEKEVKTLRSELDALKSNLAKVAPLLKSAAASLVAE